jgi:predicted GNAT family N-acyltransferase
MIRYKTASSTNELEQILALQRSNLPESLSEEIQNTEGFVTVHHDFDILKRMNNACPHIIAKKGDQVVGYALCMHPKFGNEIEVLLPMFQQIKKVLPEGESYIVMGQVCVHKAFRKQGIFRKLYETMLEHIKPEFNAIITEVDLKNSRSLEAHYGVGFTLLSRYQADGHDWDLILLS